MSLAILVELYRLCHRPKLHGGNFVCTAGFLETKEIIKRIQENPPLSVEFVNLLVDGVDYLDENLPELGGSIEFELKLPSSSSSRFHSNLAALLAVEPKISRGEIPNDFYLIEEDFYSEDSIKPDNIGALERVCRLIGGLSHLAHYHDEKSSGHCYRLVFMQPIDDKGIVPVVLETKINVTILEAAIGLIPDLVEELSNSNVSNDPHYSAKVSVFCTSLANFVSVRAPTTDAFNYLVTHWQLFIESYHRDLSTYLSGFAFHKAKKEIAEAELKIADEFSKVISEITGHLLSVPVSLVAVVAISRADNLLERLSIWIGVLVAGIVVSQLVKNQKRQLDRIKHAKNLVLGAIEGRREVYPVELAESIREMTLNLGESEKSLGRSLSLFAWLSWVPVVSATFVFLYVYYPQIHTAIVDIIQNGILC